MNSFVSSWKLRVAAIVAANLLLVIPARADDVVVLCSGAFTEASHEFIPAFERASSNKVVATFGGSMGHSPTSIPGRVERGEPGDVVIVANPTFDDLVKQRKIVPGSGVELVTSKIGAVVRAGAPKPDISSVEALKRTLLKAKSISISEGASGVYLSTDLFKRLGVLDQVMSKMKKTANEPVAKMVARGDAEIGFEQISELVPVPGISYVGPLPAEVQKVTVFFGGVAANARHPEAGRAFIKFLQSPAAASALKKSGLEPVSSR
jgi:molybdate transport system substrate-binding protein